ncbi:MAG TPA: M23 family metallopeptidase, partial [Clostridia bacterium]|nr:M23 family metallopeptidase [Clostridia bacterium]
KLLQKGDEVYAGDVIGYLGMTGYSTKENVNNIKVPHLHFGLQLIFDASQINGVNQIWIDVYNIVRLLGRNRMPVKQSTEKGEYVRADGYEQGMGGR